MLEGRGLFIYSDPGGAKPVLTVASEREKLGDEIMVISDLQYGFAKDFAVKVSNNTRHPEKVLKCFNPNYIFTGTSYKSDIEVRFIEAANKFGIQSFSFIDHWTSFRDRFKNNEEKFHFPSTILVLDENAHNLAIEEKLNQEKLVIYGNPYHEFLRNWTPKISKKNFLNSFGLDKEQKYILVAPDPISNIDGISKWGFDEIEFMDKLVDHFQEKSEIKIIIKIHPNQNFERIEKIYNKRNNVIFVIDENTHLNSLIYYSSLVVGFFSNILLEAEIMGKGIIRFIKIENEKDPLKEKINNDIVFNSYEKLFKYLKYE